MPLYLIGIILDQSFWNSKYLIIIAIVRSYIISVYMGAMQGEKFLERTPQNTLILTLKSVKNE